MSTTIAVCAPKAVGFGCALPSLPGRIGRHTTSLATASKVQSMGSFHGTSFDSK